ncbi:CHAT domain-containing protein [Streptomyces sp. NPDC048309]|uniref:CHAT domain-containing protein n=1 Tax=Streptomyces sp. NPDC048309 TaxID=3154618 RepID=UPI0033C1A1EF
MAHAVLVLGDTAWWPLSSIIGRSPSMLTGAYEGRLPRITAVEPETFKTQALAGWSAWLDLDKGELSVTSPVNPRFHYGAVPPLPPGWRETAALAGRVLLLVTGYLPPLPAGIDSADLLDRLAVQGRLHGAIIGYAESARPKQAHHVLHHPDEGDTCLPTVVAPADALVELSELVADRVLVLDEAKARARRIAWLTDKARGSASRPDSAPAPIVGPPFAIPGEPPVHHPAGTPDRRVREMTDSEIAAHAFPVGWPPERALRVHYYYLRLLVEVAEVRGGPQRSSLWPIAAARAIDAAAHLYSVTGDETLFDDANELSVRQLTLLRSQPPARPLQDALLAAAELRLAALGPLHLTGDLYARERLPCLMAARRVQLYQALEDDRPEPSSLTLRIAEANAFIEEALGTLAGPSRGRALVLRIQTGIAREQPYSLSTKQIRSLAAEARACFQGTEGPIIDLFLARLLNDLSLDEAADIFRLPLQAIVTAYGEPGARALVSQGIEFARFAGSRDLLQHVLRWSANLFEPTSDAHIRQELEASLHCLPYDETPCPAPGVDLAVLARRHLSHPRRLWSSLRRRAPQEAARAHLAAHALADDRIELGLRLLPPFESLSALGHGFSLLYADLHYEAARKSIACPDAAVPGPAWLLCQAAQKYSLLGLYGLASWCLIQVLELVEESSDDDLPGVVTAVAGVMPVLHANRDPQLARIYRDVVHTSTPCAESLEVLLGLHHAAKGPTFSQLYGTRKPFEVPEAVTHQLVRLRVASASRNAELLAPVEAPPNQSDTLIPDTELWDLSSPLSVEETALGRTAAGIEQNIKRHIDRGIHGALLQTAANGTQAPPDLHRLQESLDDRTVFLSWFLPAAAEPRSVYTMLAVTRESAEAMVTRSASGDDVPETGNEAERRPGEHDLVRMVSALRSEVTREPFFDEVVTPSGAALLARPLIPSEWLQQWRDRGKDHLRIWAHGPLHYLPLHLCSYGPEARLVADDFTVSLVAGLGTSSPPGSPTPRPARTAIIASARGGEEFGLEHESILEKHAAKIATLLGTDPIVKQAATRQRLLDELSTADVVHIAAHGTQDAGAPWFHCLYLSPDEDDDGRVFAHDILAADLRGVRLVTLASCESALGRYDINDNLRGMPAALLLAGAQALIGCLWEVQPDPATRFFADLHQRLAQGSAPLTAFREAQLETRAVFPAYRDWGAFVFLKGWHHTAQEAT